MKGGWEAWTKQDGMVGVQLANGDMITVKNDGITGYSFALEYLKKMSQYYKDHLRAADMILQRQLGEDYKHIKKIPNIYNSNLAVVSMNCVFGEMDNQPDCDEDGNFHFEFSRCPFRATCPFNGYNLKNTGKYPACCNPIYESGLTERQAQVADLLVHTEYTNYDIADALGISEKRVRNIVSEIYATLDVNTRAELMLLLKNKRLY